MKIIAYKFTDYPLICETCGHPIIMRQLDADHSMQYMQPHYYCDNPKVSIIVTRPRRLGVVTSIAE